jgi:hypothetical protein
LPRNGAENQRGPATRKGDRATARSGPLISRWISA